MRKPPVIEDYAPVNPRLIGPGTAEWPERLNELGSQRPPRKLHVTGREIDPGARSVAVVGTRRPTAAGIEAAAMLARGLAEASFVVVSGLALGIDAVAHKAALEAGGHTIAVIGCGTDLNYPRKNLPIRRRIEKEGTIVSEYEIGEPPMQHHFPERNRILAGLSEAVVVVEGSETSGALITARIALEANRSIFAVSGSFRNPQAAGPNELIRTMQATPVAKVQHIFDELAPGLVWGNDSRNKAAHVDDEEAAVLATLDDVPVAPDFIIAQTDMDQGLVLLTLSRLEIRGLVKRWNGAYEITTSGTRVRSALEAPSERVGSAQ
ncbi:MAG: DNA-processing protein DprA [Actinomycetota bacterium]